MLTSDIIEKQYSDLSADKQAEFKQRVIYKIIDDSYGDRITDFSVDHTPNSGMVASGSFSTPRLGGKSLVIDYAINDAGTVLTPRNLEVIDHTEEKYGNILDSLLKFSEQIQYSSLECFDFARTIQCSKGWACGGACLSKTKKNCHQNANEEHKTYIGWLKSQVEKGVELHQTHKDEAEKLGIKKTEKPPEEPVKEVKEETPKTYLDQPHFTMDGLKSFYKDLYHGDVSANQVKQAWGQFKNSKDQLREELGKLKKDELMKFVPFASSGTKKDELVSRSLDNLAQRFNVADSLQFDPFKKNGLEEALDKAVPGVTDEKIQAKAEQNKKRFDERQAKVQQHKKAIENPETLEDFEIRKQYKNVPELTDEQQKLFDRLTAEKNKQEREVVPTPKEVVPSHEQLGEKVSFEIKQTKHTQKGHDLFVAVPSQRVSKEEYQQLKERAEKLGGYYSSYAKDGAIAGFQFKTKEAAEQFASFEKVQKPQEKAQQEATEKQQDKQSRSGEKLAKLAESLRQNAQERLSQNRLTNTAKRAREAGYAEEAARKDLAMSQTMSNVAKALNDGKAHFLSGVDSKAHVEQLESILKQSHYTDVRKKVEGAGFNQQRNIGDMYDEPVKEESIKHAEYPYPSIHYGNLRTLADEARGIRGLKQLSEKLQQRAMQTQNEGNYQVKFKSPEDIKDLQTFLEKLNRPALKSKTEHGNLSDELKNYQRLQRAGIKTPEDLREALREYLPLRGEKQQGDPVKQMEREMVGKKIPGYFPTPPHIADRMAKDLDVKPGMTVLEPSAGKGSLVDAIKKEYGADVKVTAVEQHGGLSEILKAKGHDTIHDDFMKMPTSEKYDRIIMNPPFERDQDVDHVQHAYEMLKPGGKLVAIMSEHSFFSSTKKSKEFRDWLDEKGTSKKLPEGSFKTSDNPTGVATRLVTITKPE